jgi:hypothetical protein
MIELHTAAWICSGVIDGHELSLAGWPTDVLSQYATPFP